MNCREAELLCHRYLDKEITVTESSELLQHIRSCSRCTENWLAIRKTVDLLAALPEENPGPCLISHVMIKLPRARSRFYLKLNAWQAAAAVLIVAAVTSLGFFMSPQLTATTVESGEGKAVVVPRPGRLFIIPPGATVDGDLIVQGDVYLRGRVQGAISATGRIARGKAARGFWDRIVEAFADAWRALTSNH